MSRGDGLKVDVAVVGGGLVGLATALALAGRGLEVAVLEAEERLATHQSGHNSGVIHSGLYYKPGSLKARLSVAGARSLYRLCEEEGIAHERCGKLVLATEPEELPRLEELERRGAANGLQGLRRLGAGELREVEPHAAGIAALHIPETGIVDYKAVAQAYARRIEARGGTVRTASAVTAVRSEPAGLAVETVRGVVRARLLVNCGGLQCDRVARLAGARPTVRIVPFRGEYYDLRPAARSLVRGLIYPVPDPRFPFLGVHLTRRVDGTVEAGPNAVLTWRREGYRKGSFSPRDAASILSFPGFWRLAARHWKTALMEVRRSWSKDRFARDLARLVPDLTPADLTAGGSGVRAQAVDAQGNTLDDFHLVESPRALHVLNAPSPGATASLAIGEELARRAVAMLG